MTENFTQAHVRVLQNDRRPRIELQLGVRQFCSSHTLVLQLFMQGVLSWRGSSKSTTIIT